MSLLSLALVVSMATEGLTLRIDTPMRKVLIGEPIRLTVRWAATEPIHGVAIEYPDFHFQSIRLAVEHAGAIRIYREYRHIGDRILVREALDAGEERLQDYVFYVGTYGADSSPASPEFLFPTPGTHRVRAIYVDGGRRTDVVSNAIEFEVRGPENGDAEILDALRKDRGLLGGDGDRALARKLLDQRPGSPYLRLFKLLNYRHRANRLGSDYDPDTGQSLLQLGEEGSKAYRRQYYARMVEEILADPDWAPFEDEALELAAMYSIGAGDIARARNLEKEIVEKHPNSPTAERLKSLRR